jgi:hypothetical protein
MLKIKSTATGHKAELQCPGICSEIEGMREELQRRFYVLGPPLEPRTLAETAKGRLEDAVAIVTPLKEPFRTKASSHPTVERTTIMPAQRTPWLL